MVKSTGCWTIWDAARPPSIPSALRRSHKIRRGAWLRPRYRHSRALTRARRKPATPRRRPPLGARLLFDANHEDPCLGRPPLRTRARRTPPRPRPRRSLPWPPPNPRRPPPPRPRPRRSLPWPPPWPRGLCSRQPDRAPERPAALLTAAHATRCRCVAGGAAPAPLQAGLGAGAGRSHGCVAGGAPPAPLPCGRDCSCAPASCPAAARYLFKAPAVRPPWKCPALPSRRTAESAPSR